MHTYFRFDKLLNTTGEDVCLVMIDYAGLSTNTDDLYQLSMYIIDSNN